MSVWIYGSVALLGVAIGCDCLARWRPAVAEVAHGLAFWLALVGQSGLLVGLAEVVRRGAAP